MDWASAEAALERGVASVFDVQSFKFVALKPGPSVNATPVADASRASFVRNATLELAPPGIARASGNQSERDQRTAFEAVLTADISTWPWMPRGDDLVREIGQDWVVKNLDRDGSRRIIIYLNRSR